MSTICLSNSSPGISNTALFITSQTVSAGRYLKESYSLGGVTRKTLEELYDVAEECSTPGWDGYGGVPISQSAYFRAYQLIEALPNDAPQPEIVPDPDGAICLEWYRDERHILSVAIGPDSELHYSATFGPRYRSGSDVSFGDWPGELLSLIYRVYR